MQKHRKCSWKKITLIENNSKYQQKLEENQNLESVQNSSEIHFFEYIDNRVVKAIPETHYFGSLHPLKFLDFSLRDAV